MAWIKVRNGNTGHVYAIVDDDFAHLADFAWHLSSKGYARRQERYGPRSENKRRTIYLHREVMGFPDHTVDHVNGDKLDNRVSNLDICSVGENTRRMNLRISAAGGRGYASPEAACA